MKIDKSVAIEVTQVENGFLVRLPYHMARGEFQAVETSLVFQSFAALVSWMTEHFSHRGVGIKSDA